MRTLLVVISMLLCSISALATSYTTNDNSGTLNYQLGQPLQFWTPRIPGLTNSSGNPHMFPTTFTDATMSVLCNPTCGIGNAFSISLSMSNFTVSQYLYGFAGDVFVGTLNLVTSPIILRSASGIAIAHFTLTGNLEACTDSSCSDELFSLAVFVRGYATMAYNLSSGQLTVSSVTYNAPEPSSLTLLGMGLVFLAGKVRAGATERKRCGLKILG